MTPTIHALRGDRYKFIRPYGLWDVEELYDLDKDPQELTNLVRELQHQARVKEMRTRLFALLKETKGMAIPLFEDRDGQSNRRLNDATPQGSFPPQMIQP